MAVFTKTFSGKDHHDVAGYAMDVIRGAIKILCSNAKVSEEVSGTKVLVSLGMDGDLEPGLRKILEGLGFEYEYEDKYGEKKAEEEPIPTEALKILDLNAANAEGEYRVPSGRYRKDGTDIVYNAAGLTIRLQRQEFGPGIRFFREGDGTKWVVVLLDSGFQLKQIED